MNTIVYCPSSLLVYPPLPPIKFHSFGIVQTPTPHPPMFYMYVCMRKMHAELSIVKQ